jgi:hypothetical protein
MPTGRQARKPALPVRWNMEEQEKALILRELPLESTKNGASLRSKHRCTSDHRRLNFAKCVGDRSGSRHSNGSGMVNSRQSNVRFVCSDQKKQNCDRLTSSQIWFESVEFASKFLKKPRLSCELNSEYRTETMVALPDGSRRSTSPVGCLSPKSSTSTKDFVDSTKRFVYHELGSFEQYVAYVS